MTTGAEAAVAAMLGPHGYVADAAVGAFVLVNGDVRVQIQDRFGSMPDTISEPIVARIIDHNGVVATFRFRSLVDFLDSVDRHGP